VTPAVIIEDQQDLAPLFAGPARWGFETVVPAPPAISPERDHPPARREVKLVPRIEAAGLRTATIIVTIGAVGVLVMDNALGVHWLFSARGSNIAVLLVVNILAAVVAFWAGRAWQRSRPGADLSRDASVGKKDLIPLLNAGATFFLPEFVLTVEAVIGWIRILKGKKELVPDPADSKKADEEYAAAVSAWQQRVAQFEAAERRRFDSADAWFPVPFSGTARMVCVFGGTDISWNAALSTLGASLLGGGARILIGDLSRHRTTDVLRDLCGRDRRPLARVTLPGSEGAQDIFAGLSWNDLSTLLAEVLHAAQGDLDVSRRERQEDRAVIREVAACLAPDGPVSVARLREALLVVQAADVPVDGVVAAGEYDRLSRLYNEVQRQHGGVLERVTRIERVLRDFEVLDGNGSRGARPGPAAEPGRFRPGDGSIEIIEVDKKSDDLDSERLVDLLFQLLLRHVRKGSAQADVLIVLGADRLRRGALESLMSSAEYQRIAVLLFFEHLRDDAIELIGGGGAAAAFFALGNHKEAREASDFIGASYKWVESQHTKSAGESLTGSWGENTGQSSSWMQPVTETQGRSYTESFGRTKDYSAGEQRVREAVMEPEVIMGLPVTGMIYVEVLPGGRRVTANVDCNPQVVFGSRVARKPRALMPSA
jgi:hypothetical protein